MVNAGARLDRLPITAFHRKLLYLIGLGGLFDSFDIYLGGSVLAALVEEGWSDVNMNAWFISATFGGMTLGAWLAGVLGDRYGRKFTYQTNLLIFGLASLAAVFAPSMSWLIFFRFVMGLGLGAELVAATGMLSEFIPPNHRGRWYALMSCLINFGMFLQTVLSQYLIPNYSWRSMFLVAAVGALALWFARKNMPESPRWLEQQGRFEEADEILTKIEKQVQSQTGAPLPDPVVITRQAQSPASLASLFKPGILSRTIVASVICIVVNTTAFSFVTWLPTFFVKEGLSVASSLEFLTFMSFGGPIGAIVGYLLADKLGRRLGILYSVPCALVFALIYPFTRDPILTPLVGFLFLTSLYAFFAFGFYGYLGELFPTAFRLRGIGFAHTVGRAATMATPFIVAVLYTHYEIYGVIGLVAISLVSVFIAVLFWGLETRNRTLEQLEEHVDIMPNNQADSGLVSRASP